MMRNPIERGQLFWVGFLALLLILPACYHSKRSHGGLGLGLAQPGGLNALAASSTDVDLLWVDASTTETGYEVERSSDGVNYDQVAVLPADSTSYSDVVPGPEIQYSYRVRAVNDGTASDFSNIAFVTPMAGPTGLKADPQRSNLVGLTWEDNSEFEDGYVVQKSLDGESFFVAGKTDPDVAVYQDRRAAPGVEYIYKVVAFNLLGGVSDFSLDSKTTPPPMAWAAAYCGRGDSEAMSIIQTADKGWAVVGTTDGFGLGLSDLWVLKLNADGTIAWEIAFGGNYDDYGRVILQTQDQGFLVMGDNTQFGAGGSDIWILKLNPDGTVAWQKTYGGADNDHVTSAVLTPDNDCIVAGFTSSFGAGSSDAWILNIDPMGAVKWQKTYGDGAEDKAMAVGLKSTGNIVVAGATSSFGAANSDFWLFETDPLGTMVWEKRMGAPKNDMCRSIAILDDDSIVAAGDSESIREDKDAWVLKLDTQGEILWQSLFSGGKDDFINSVRAAFNNTVVLGGSSFSFGDGDQDQWALRLGAADGAILWQKSYTGVGDDLLNDIIQADDMGFIIAGTLSSPVHTLNNLGVLRINPDGHIDFREWAKCQVKNTVCKETKTSETASNTSATVADTSVAPLDTAGNVTNTWVVIKFQ